MDKIGLIKDYNNVVRIPPAVYKPNAKPSFSPSSLGTPCLRKCFYDYTKAPKEANFPIKAARVLTLGNLVGDHLSDTFRKAKILVDYVDEQGKTPITFGKPNHEFPIRAPKLGINWGFIDGVFIKDDVLSLGEFKSIKYEQYIELKQPKPDHLVQGITYLVVFNYMLASGKYAHIPQLSGFKRATGITFLYYNKNTSYLKEFYVTETHEVFKKIVARVSYIIGIQEGCELPPKTQDYCKTCNYAKRCDANQMPPRFGGPV